MNKKVLILVIAVSLLFFSCNLLSFRNISNDFKWKNKKFGKPYELVLSYNPQLITKTLKKTEPLFVERADTIDADLKYSVKELLQKKLQKRNIICKDTGAVKLFIDKIKFEEYAEEIALNDNDGNFIGMDDKHFFIFEMEGRIIKDTVERSVKLRYEHNAEPRESYIIPGMIVHDGIGASTQRMVENAVNIFSYTTYEKLNEIK